MTAFENSRSKRLFAFIRTISEVYIGPAPEEFEPDDSFIEARFFDQNGEFRVFRLGDEILSKEISFSGREFIERSFKTADDRFGNEISVRYLIDYDRDGQAFICNACLSNWKGGNDNG